MTTIKLKNGSGAPAGGDLVQGEPALDLTNKRLYTEDSGGNVIEVGTNPGVDVTFADNRKAVFGAGSDLQIYHDGSNSFVEDTGTGALFAKTNGTGVFLYSGSEALATFNTNGASNLYYDNALKLSTTSTGIDVTGTVTADGLTVSASAATANITSTSGGATLNLTHPTATDGYSIRQGNANADDFRIFEGSKIKLNITTGGDISFYEDTGTTAKFFWDASAESLGIGTSSPARALHVVGTGRPAEFGSDNIINYVKLYNSATGNGTYNGLDFLVNSTSNSQINAYGMPLTFGTSASNGTNVTERMRIDASGNVGINNTVASTIDSSSGLGNLVVGSGSGNEGITIYTGSSSYGGLNFADATSGGGSYAGYIKFDHSDNSFGHFIGNTERMRIDSSGNLYSQTTTLNVGTSSTETGMTHQAGQLQVSANGYQAAIFNRLQDGTIADFRVDGTAVGSIDTVGGADIKVVFSSDGDQYITGNAAANYLSFSSANAERMRLDGSGNLLVGTTSATGSGASSGKQVTQFNGATGNGLYVDDTRTAAGTDNAIIFGRGATITGAITTTLTTTAYVTSSDQRLKDNIVDAPSASDDIDAIQVRSFDWKADGSHQKYGMVAQELNTVAPEAVSAPEDPEEMMGVDYSKLVPMLVKEIQSLRARVAQLETN